MANLPAIMVWVCLRDLSPRDSARFSRSGPVFPGLAAAVAFRRAERSVADFQDVDRSCGRWVPDSPGDDCSRAWPRV